MEKNLEEDMEQLDDEVSLDMVNSLKEKIELQKADIDDKDDRLKRLMAEFDNFKKRSAKERELLYNSLISDIISNFLPVVDNLEKAVNANTGDEGYKQGVELVLKQFKVNSKSQLDELYKFIDNVILQLASYHSYDDLKIVILTDKNNEPLPNKTLIVKYSDGTTKEEVTDEDGRIRTNFLFNYGGQYVVTCTFTGDDDYDACSIENKINVIDERQANAIKTVKIDFQEPKDGMTSNRPLITVSGNCTIDEDNTYWTLNRMAYRELFRDGDDYQLKYTIKPNNGYHFDDKVNLIVNGISYGEVYPDKDSNITGYTDMFHVEVDEIIEEEQEFTVSFITYDGLYKEVKVKANEYLEKPLDPMLDGFDFEGWYVDNGFTHEYKFVDRVKRDFYLYAKFKQKEEYARKVGGSQTIFHISKEGDFGEMTNTIDSDKSLADTDIDQEINKWKSLDKYDAEIKYGEVKVLGTTQVQHIYIHLKPKEIEIIETLEEHVEDDDVIDINKTIEFDPEGTDFKRIAKTLTLSL